MRPLLDVKVLCESDVGGDHYHQAAHKVFDIKLCAPEVKRQFSIEPRNRFSALEIEDGEDQDIVKTTWSDHDRKSVS